MSDAITHITYLVRALKSLGRNDLTDRIEGLKGRTASQAKPVLSDVYLQLRRAGGEQAELSELVKQYRNGVVDINAEADLSSLGDLFVGMTEEEDTAPDADPTALSPNLSEASDSPSSSSEPNGSTVTEEGSGDLDD